MIDFQQSLEDLLQAGLDHKIITHQELVYAACQVARTTLHLIPEDENGPRISIETAERWCRGEANLKEVSKAANHANDAYTATTSTTAASATYAAYAVSATHAAAYVVSTVFYATSSEKENEMKNLLLSHLPRLNKMKAFL